MRVNAIDASDAGVECDASVRCDPIQVGVQQHRGLVDLPLEVEVVGLVTVGDEVVEVEGAVAEIGVWRREREETISLGEDLIGEVVSTHLHLSPLALYCQLSVQAPD